MERAYVFRDTRVLARWGMGFVLVQAVLAGLSVWAGPLSDPAAEPVPADVPVLLVALAQMLLYIIGGIVILVWIARTNANAHVIGTLEMESGPGWAVGWWFVPLGNLFMPFRVVREIWAGSATAIPGEPPPSGALLGIWWLLWVISNIVGLVGVRLGWEAEDAETLAVANNLDLASNLLAIPAALLFAAIISRIQHVQNRAAPMTQPAGSTA